MTKVTFHWNGQVKTVEAEAGKPILQIALDAGIPMEHACGGNGFCTTCMCTVSKGMDQLSPRNEREENMGVTEDPLRLGCQTIPEGTGEVEIEIAEF